MYLRKLASCLALSSVLTSVSIAAEAIDQETPSTRLARFTCQQKQDWQEFQRSGQNIVSYIHQISSSNPRAAAWLIKTGGAYGIADRKATPEEERLIRSSLSNIAEKATARPDQYQDVLQEFHATQHEKNVIQILTETIQNIRADHQKLCGIVSDHSSRIGNLEAAVKDGEKKLERRTQSLEARIEDAQNELGKEKALHAQAREQNAQQFKSVLEAQAASEERIAKALRESKAESEAALIKFGEQRSLDLKSFREFVEENRAKDQLYMDKMREDAQRERDRLEAWIQRIDAEAKQRDAEAKEREAKYQAEREKEKAEAKEREAKYQAEREKEKAEAEERYSALERRLTADNLKLEQKLQTAHEKIEELNRKVAELTQEAADARAEIVAAESRVKQELEEKHAATIERLTARLERVAGVQKSAFDTEITDQKKLLRSALKRIPVAGATPPAAPRAVGFTPAVAGERTARGSRVPSSRATTPSTAVTPSSPSVRSSRPTSANSIVMVEADGGVLPEMEHSLGTLSAHTEIERELRRITGV